jgi:hypothetical protein
MRCGLEFYMGCSAQAVQEALIAAVHEFVDNAPHIWRDDITLMVVVRDS